MEKIAILTDSTSDLPKSLMCLDNVYVIPLYVNMDGKYYKDGVDVSLDDVNLYNENNKKNLAKSSAPSPGDFDDIIKKIRDDGYEKIIAIMVSSNLSATFQILNIQASEDPNIKVIDSKSASLGESLLLVYSLDLINEGLSFDEISIRLDQVIDSKDLYVWFDSLENLKAGGRLTAHVSKALGILNLKPLLKFNKDGKIDLIKLKVKEKRAIKQLVERVREDLKDSRKYYLGLIHGSDESSVSDIEKQAKDLIDNSLGYFKNTFGSVVGVHVGSKAYAFLYLKVD